LFLEFSQLLFQHIFEALRFAGVYDLLADGSVPLVVAVAVVVEFAEDEFVDAVR
jgi:hypothetical protein